MAISLKKGQKISLTKDNPSLKKIMVGLGWKANDDSSESDFDLDASVLMCNEKGKCIDKSDFVYFGNLTHPSGSVIHLGDNVVGSVNNEQKDDEQIIIDLSIIPQDIYKLVFVVTIYKAEDRKQNFGQVSNAFIRVLDLDKEIIRYDLTENFKDETAVVIGEIYRYKKEWKFNAIGSGFKGGISELLGHYGIKFAGFTSDIQNNSSHTLSNNSHNDSLDNNVNVSLERSSLELSLLNNINLLRNTDNLELMSKLRNLDDNALLELSSCFLKANLILENLE